MTTDYDVVIVGARVAGAVTALHLARAGRSVLIVDRAGPPADTLSTHSLMRTAVVQLHRAGLLADLAAMPTPAIRRMTLGFGDQVFSFDVRSEFGVDALYAPRRTVLDPLILSAASRAGADVALGRAVTGIDRDESGRVSGVSIGRGTDTVRVSTRYVVGADLGTLERQGVRIAGRVLGARGRTVEFGDNLEHDAAEADRRLLKLLDRFDEWARDASVDGELDPPLRPPSVRVHAPVSGRVDLATSQIGTVVWATGYRQSYPWLDLDVLNDCGEMIHRRGVTDVPGLYVLGLGFLWRRGSHFVDGVGRDAEYLADVITGRVGASADA